MVKVIGQYKIKSFEYFYMFVMVIYMAQMTFDTGRMVFSLGGNPIPLLIPMVLTLILLLRNKVSFANRNLGLILLLTTVWCICILIKLDLHSLNGLSSIFFLYYAIIIAFIHCQVFGRRLGAIYEDIMVVFAKISIPLWLFAVLLPDVATPFFRLFPETSYGNNFLYLFNWMAPTKGQIYSILRNAGCSWEPGRFSIMIALAICFNLLRNGVKFRNNRNIIWLMLAMLSTQSTTGYSITIFLYLIFYIKRVSVGYILGFLFILLPIAYGVFQLNFMIEKIEKRLSVVQEISVLDTTFESVGKSHLQGQYAGSLDRFESLYFEFYNIVKDPILGYSRNIDHSYFYKNISTNVVLTGGLFKVIAQMGIPFGLFLYYILYRSSVVIANENDNKKRTAIFFTILLSSISYNIFIVPIFTTVWFYAFLKNKGEKYYDKKQKRA